MMTSQNNDNSQHVVGTSIIITIACDFPLMDLHKHNKLFYFNRFYCTCIYNILISKGLYYSLTLLHRCLFENYFHQIMMK